MNVVHLKGAVAKAAGASNPFVTLPAGFLPSATRSFAINISTQAAGSVEVTSAGQVSVFDSARSGPTNGITYQLDGITFLAEA